VGDSPARTPACRRARRRPAATAPANVLKAYEKNQTCANDAQGGYSDALKLAYGVADDEGEEPSLHAGG